MYKNCEHAEYLPGIKLCQYLMSNSSTEFADRNFRRALACINGQREAPPRYVLVERLDTLMWGYEIPGIRTDISVGVEFVSKDGNSPFLKILAEADEP